MEDRKKIACLIAKQKYCVGSHIVLKIRKPVILYLTLPLRLADPLNPLAVEGGDAKSALVMLSFSTTKVFLD